MTLPSWAGAALKFAPAVLLALAAVALYLAGQKIDSLKAQLAAADARVETLAKEQVFFAQAVADRDALISKQNASIDALAAAAAADRTVYLKGLEAARAVSADHLKASSELLALTAPEGELAQCRAARDLLETELVQ
jgi:hypothetical protein